MLRIRLRRTGKTKQPTYRVVIADSRAKRDGDFVEIVGHYNPRTRPSTLELKEERIRHWLAQGALPSETVHRLLYKQGLTTVEPPKRATKPSKAEVEAQRAAEEAAAAQAAEQAAAAAAAEAPAEEAAPAEESAEEPASE
jgi:small subunit ribosomal protein S16